MDDLEKPPDHVYKNSSINGYVDSVEDAFNDVVVTTQEKTTKDVENNKAFNPVSPTGDEAEHPFLYSNDMSDLRLIVEGRPLYVSRVVLSLVSPVFKR